MPLYDFSYPNLAGYVLHPESWLTNHRLTRLRLLVLRRLRVLLRCTTSSARTSDSRPFPRKGLRLPRRVNPPTTTFSSLIPTWRTRRECLLLAMSLLPAPTATAHPQLPPSLVATTTPIPLSVTKRRTARVGPSTWLVIFRKAVVGF
jgi:hypothetical protein